MNQSLKHLGIFLLWNVAASISLLLLPVPAGVLVAMILGWLVLWRYLLRTGQPGEAKRQEMLRLRPLRQPVLGWTVAAVPVFLVLAWSLSTVYFGLVPVPPEVLAPFEALTGTPLGRLSVALLAVGVAPVLEEFFFRGLIQQPLEARWGAAPAIGFSASLFAVIHLLPWVLPLHLFLGLVFGWAVYATGSIWVAVILHAANNIAAVAGMRAMAEQPAVPTVWEAGPGADWWAALAVLLVSAVAALWVGRGLWRAGRGALPAG